ncbi:hypothetical protein BC835DRAFT_662717 [Cytidiella melzeri]|nr:hypothetical protein BC835DRAFT_662717 [Cytidiella melzeri]
MPVDPSVHSLNHSTMDWNWSVCVLGFLELILDGDHLSWSRIRHSLCVCLESLLFYACIIYACFKVLVVRATLVDQETTVQCECFVLDCIGGRCMGELGAWGRNIESNIGAGFRLACLDEMWCIANEFKVSSSQSRTRTWLWSSSSSSSPWRS